MANKWYQFTEFALWVATVVAAIVGAFAVVSFVLGSGLLTLKYILFVVGFLLFGVGSFAIQPKSPRRDRKRVTLDSDSEYGFEARIQDILPSEGRLPLEERVSRNTKLFVVSLVILGVSYLLEVGFDIAG
ncbi:hypothetical protein [Haloferax sp. DFSO52]|uniref:DUF7555 family protein n=1 Tax=Haloferax sp. DFSO52 TaxID=3388505 RepID=UPI003A8B2E4B